MPPEVARGQCSNAVNRVQRALRPARTPPEPLRPRQAEEALGRRGQRGLRQGFEVVARVHERQVLGGCLAGRLDVGGLEQRGRKQFLEQQRVLGHRERVRRRQRQVVVAVIVAAQSYRHETSDLSSLERVT